MELELSYAGFWKRFIAYVIDSIVVNVVLVAIWILTTIFFIGISGGLTGVPEDAFAAAEAFGVPLALPIFIMGGLIVPWLYWAFLESSPEQATLGKMALRIIVTDREGNRISFAKATGRYWAKIISASILLMGFVMASFTAKKQALHDKIVDSLVVVK